MYPKYPYVVELGCGSYWSSDCSGFYGVWRGNTLWRGLVRICESILVAWNWGVGVSDLVIVKGFTAFGAETLYGVGSLEYAKVSLWRRVVRARTRP
jgi:hypothetical protein